MMIFSHTSAVVIPRKFDSPWQTFGMNSLIMNENLIPAFGNSSLAISGALLLQRLFVSSFVPAHLCLLRLMGLEDATLCSLKVTWFNPGLLLVAQIKTPHLLCCVWFPVQLISRNVRKLIKAAGV